MERKRNMNHSEERRRIRGTSCMGKDDWIVKGMRLDRRRSKGSRKASCMVGGVMQESELNESVFFNIVMREMQFSLGSDQRPGAMMMVA
ncbi:hypothetical protein M407DRAFT_193709 [Tulasnella calospora MUT 4182]|uniref:Uncharacterized protein n=1 Tax=Tulasnella calospora MUT 4182 TaxID=1051891 RepID=A0A0C3QAA4_9AGAM|nr:hypothetical protein M407DRAFT_193709 [Tulasnella calospora MUT 4182]